MYLMFYLLSHVHLIGSQNALEEILSSGKRLKASADIKTALGLAPSPLASLISQPKASVI